ncbi:MAG: hypothetical protein AB3X41_12825 [Leptothrix ochracea]|uniref:hypothetical protein n=1 Tax=Leptothrix ochracea TaxID=735331 RepID=UPI0034E1F545
MAQATAHSSRVAQPHRRPPLPRSTNAHAVRPDPVVTVRPAQTTWTLNADPALVLANAAHWGMLAVTTFHRLGVCTSVMEVSRVDIDAERVMLCSGGAQAIQLRRQQGLRGRAGYASQSKTLDGSFTIGFNDAEGEPVMTLAVLNPSRVAGVIESLRYHAKKASMPDAGHSDAKVSSSSTPLHLSISTLLRCRDDHDALSLDLLSHHVRHRYIGPIHLARRCSGLVSKPHYSGDGMTLQLTPSAIHSISAHTLSDGTPGVNVHSLGGGHLGIAPASGIEFATWWAEQALLNA